MVGATAEEGRIAAAGPAAKGLQAARPAAKAYKYITGSCSVAVATLHPTVRREAQGSPQRVCQSKWGRPPSAIAVHQQVVRQGPLKQHIVEEQHCSLPKHYY